MNTTKQWYNQFNPIPADPIMQANLDYIADTRPNKINAGIGMIMDPHTRKPFVSFVLKRIGKQIAFDDNGYLPSIGHMEYLDAHAKHLIFGVKLWEQIKDTVVKAQTIGGTNALTLSAEILKLSLPNELRKILLDTGWPNHPKIFNGFEITNYIHENPESREYNHDIYMQTLRNHPNGTVVILQIGGYNDDGTERNDEQWEEIITLCIDKKLIPILDFAYNGLVNGWDVDATPIKKFVEAKCIVFVCASNSKNVAYNARLGSLYIVNLPVNVVNNIQDTLSNTIIRPFFSNPPAFAAQTVAFILQDEILRNEYKNEVTDIRVNLLETNRKILAETLGTGYEWITNKRGMFLKLKYDGWTDIQFKFLKEDNAIHGPKNSRLNMGGFDPNKMRDIALIYQKALSM